MPKRLAIRLIAVLAAVPLCGPVMVSRADASSGHQPVPQPVLLELLPTSSIKSLPRRSDEKTGTCNCDFGAQGNAVFELGPGVFSVTAVVESTFGTYEQTTAPGVCESNVGACAYYAWNKQGSSWRVLKFLVSAPGPVLIIETWCS